MLICPNCKKNIRAGSKFCSNCGFELKNTKEEQEKAKQEIDRQNHLAKIHSHLAPFERNIKLDTLLLMLQNAQKAHKPDAFDKCLSDFDKTFQTTKLSKKQRYNYRLLSEQYHLFYIDRLLEAMKESYNSADVLNLADAFCEIFNMLIEQRWLTEDTRLKYIDAARELRDKAFVIYLQDNPYDYDFMMLEACVLLKDSNQDDLLALSVRQASLEEMYNEHKEAIAIYADLHNMLLDSPHKDSFVREYYTYTACRKPWKALLSGVNFVHDGSSSIQYFSFNDGKNIYTRYNGEWTISKCESTVIKKNITSEMIEDLIGASKIGIKYKDLKTMTSSIREYFRN